MEQLLLLCSSSCIGVIFVIIMGLLIFREDLCKKWPKFPLLCHKKSKKGGGDVGTLGNMGSSVPNGTTGKATISTFGGKGDDNGIGMIGVDLYALGNSGISFQGNKLIPVAVHQSHGAGYLYKILKIKADSLPEFYGFVSDVCDSSQDECNKNVKANGMNFLIDIHETGWQRLGLNSKTADAYFKTGTYTVVGQIKPSELPKSVFSGPIQSGKESMLCYCSGQCKSGKELKWAEFGKC